MSNQLDNIPSTADVPETTDTKTLTNLTALVERSEATVSREEAATKNQERLAEMMFETFLDDNGSMKDIAHSAEVISALRQTQAAMDRSCERVEAAQHDMPTSIKAHLCEDDRNLLDSNFIRLKNLIRLNLPIVIGIGALVGICLMGSVMVSKSANDRRHDYEQRLNELDRWHQENVEAISFGQFYRESYPKKYREWKNRTLAARHRLSRLPHPSLLPQPPETPPRRQIMVILL